MDYLKQDLAFEKWCENNYLPISAYVIWRKLFKRFNRGGWCEWVTVDNLTLMSETQLKSEKSLILYRDKLIEAGLIEYIKGIKSKPNKYKMNQLYTVTDTVETTVESAVETTVENAVQSGSLQYNKTKTETKTKTSTREPRHTHRFTPPTLEEVQAYCQERANGIDAEYFLDFYSSKGWKIGRESMKDWQSAVRTWEKRENNNFNKPAEKQGSGNPFYDIYLKEVEKERNENT